MNNILKYTTLIYALLVFIGCSIQYFFFAEFKINIIGDLSFNDAILSFLPSIIFLLFLFFIPCAFCYFYYLWIHPRFKKLGIKNQGILILIGILFVFYFPITLVLFNFPYHKILLFYILLILPAFVYLLDDFFERKELFNKKEYKGIFKYIFYAFILAMMIILSSFYASTKADDLLKGRSKVANVSFCYEGQDIETNENLIFIGSTSGYLFLYNKIKNESHTYEKSNVRFLKYRD